MGKFLNGYQKLGEIGLDLFLLNVYWVIGTLLGGILLGVFPSTVALYACIRQKEVYGFYKGKLYKVFWTFYKQEFLKANKLGALIYLISFMLYIDFRLLTIFDMGIMGALAVSVLAILTIVFVLILLYLFPIYVQFDDTLKNYIKRSVILVIGKPKETVIAFILAVIVFVAYYNLPGLIPVFGISILALILFKVVLVDIFKYERVRTSH